MQNLDLLSISTFFLMVFTGFYVFFTYRLQKETKRSVDEINRPEVVVTLHVDSIRLDPSHPIIYHLTLVVMNVGTRTARNIRLSCDKSFIPASCAPLITLKYFTNEIDILMQGKRVTDVILSTDDISEIYDVAYYEHRESKTEVKVEYQRANGTKYKDEFTLDFNNRDDHRL